MSTPRHGLRVLALPLTKPRHGGKQPAFVFYHVQSPPDPTPSTGTKKPPNLLKRSIDKAMEVWTGFGKEDKNSWKFKLYAWGERAADRVEFEETALRTVNTSFKSRTNETQVNERVLPDGKAEFLYPRGFEHSLEAWRTHLQEREPYHKKYFYLWMLGLPVTAPIGIAPIIPNIPFYFCGWRAWSHWKAWGGTTYLNQLFAINYFEPINDATLSRIYDRSSSTTPASSSSNLSISSSNTTSVTQAPSSTPSDDAVAASTTEEKKDGASSSPESAVDADPEIDSQILLRPSDIPHLAESFDLSPTIRAEILRAIDQSKMRLRKERKQEQEQEKRP